MTEIEKCIEAMAARWPSPVVARKAVGDFSGGTLSPKTCANEDSAGSGIEGRFLLMNQVVYPVDALVAWLKGRAAKSWAERK
jgi:hypothetical protein